MPLLDEDESVFSSHLEINDGVNAVISSTENSVSEYSHARVQRANEARQRIDQRKEKQDTVDNKDTGLTISEDLAEGQTAKLEASLKLLSEDELKLIIPSDELEDDEIHLIETNLGVPQGLKDYQSQLMLLEQANKKRFLQAVSRGNHPSFEDRTQFEQAAAREFARRSKKFLVKKKQIQTKITQKKFPGDLEAAQVEPNVLAMHADIAATIPGTKRQKHRHRSQLNSGELDDSNAVNGSHLVEVSHHCIEVRQI